MDRNELWQLIQKSEKMFERRKLKRFALTVLFYAVVLMMFFYWQDQLSRNIWDILSAFIVCLVFSIISVLLNTVIFDQLFRLSKEEEEALEYLRKRLREKEQEDNY